VDHPIDDASKAKTTLGWNPEVDFVGLMRIVVDADLARLSRMPTTPAGVEAR